VLTSVPVFLLYPNSALLVVKSSYTNYHHNYLPVSCPSSVAFLQGEVAEQRLGANIYSSAKCQQRSPTQHGAIIPKQKQDLALTAVK
jgi:hypothetical protein